MCSAPSTQSLRFGFDLLGFEKGQANREASVEFKSSKKNGGKLLVINGVRFFRNRQRNGKQYWKCSYYYKQKCPTIAILSEENNEIKMVHEHSHAIELLK